MEKRDEEQSHTSRAVLPAITFNNWQKYWVAFECIPAEYCQVCHLSPLTSPVTISYLRAYNWFWAVCSGACAEHCAAHGCVLISRRRLKEYWKSKARSVCGPLWGGLPTILKTKILNLINLNPF